MKSSDQILNFIEERIGHIFFRPLMYGGTASGVDLILHNYHELWSDIYERHDEFHDVTLKILSEEDCGSNDFPSKYKQEHPESSEIESAFYVVDQWIKISELLAVPIPYDKIKDMFKDFVGENRNRMLNTKLMA